jgi:transcriptional regulator with XRE-family HTH domain
MTLVDVTPTQALSRPRPRRKPYHRLQRTAGLPERLRQSITRYGSTTSFEERIGRSEGAIRKWFRGESEPNATDLRIISEATKTSVEWLLFGVDEPLHFREVVDLVVQLGQRTMCKISPCATAWSELTPAERSIAEARARLVVSAWLACERRRAHAHQEA